MPKEVLKVLEGFKADAGFNPAVMATPALP